MSTIPPSTKGTFRFDGVTVDAENFRVNRNGREINLTPRAFDVLVFLIQRHGRVVEKQEIFESIWKSKFVSDSALTKVIKEIRRALEDPASRPRYIETVPKRGHRFIGEIDVGPAEETEDETEKVPGTEGSPSRIASARSGSSKTTISLVGFGLALIATIAVWYWARRDPPTTELSPIRVVAVLPFKPLDAGSRNESLELGMAETLIARLSNLRQIAVRPMSAVRKYTDVQQDSIAAGKDVDAEAVLEGSIQKAAERIRVSVMLIDVRSGRPLWSEQFDESFTDIFKVQDSIAERVTNALALELSGQEKDQLVKHYTDSPEAYELYSSAQLVWHGRRHKWIEQSLELYKLALAKDPSFALAYVGVAECYIHLNGYRKVTAAETEANARPAIQRALELDPALAQAHNALADLKYQYEYDWAGAEDEFERAIGLNPNVARIRQAYSWYLMSAARFDEAAAQLETAHRLDPSSLSINVVRGRLLYYSREYDKAIQHFRNMIFVEPNDASLHLSLYSIYERKQMYREAVDSFLTTQRLNGRSAEGIEVLRTAFETEGWHGFLRKRLEGLESSQTAPPVGFADILTQLGRKDDAIVWLQRAVEAREPAVIQFKVEPAYDSLREDPRFAELLRTVGLEP